MYVLIFLVILLYGYCSLIYFPVMDYAFPTLGLSILFRSYRFLLSSFYQFLGSTRWSRDKWICSCIRPIRMNGREEGKKRRKKFESTVYPVPFDASTCRIRFTRGVSILLCVASRTQSSPPRDTIAIFQPSNNLSFVQRTIDTDEHGISPHGIFGSTVKIVDKPVTLRSLS